MDRQAFLRIEPVDTLVTAALQGLTPIEPEEQRILKAVAEQRVTAPFLPGACEGVLYYMLEGRPETRGLFEANAQVQLENGRFYEIDIVSRNRRLAIEIDGPEHDALSGRLRDERKQADLKAANIEICRLTNAQILEDPAEVWRLIRDRL